MRFISSLDILDVSYYTMFSFYCEFIYIYKLYTYIDAVLLCRRELLQLHQGGRHMCDSHVIRVQVM